MKKLILFTVFSTVCWRYVNCDFINPLNFIRVERAVTIPGKRESFSVCRWKSSKVFMIKFVSLQMRILQ